MTEEIEQKPNMEKKQFPEKQGKNKEIGYKKPPKEYQWKPGESGNPRGRPIFSLISILKELLKELIKEKPTGEMKEKARVMMEIYLNMAILEKDKDVIKDIINHIDGTPTHTLGFDFEDLITSLKVEIVKPKEEIKEEKICQVESIKEQ